MSKIALALFASGSGSNVENIIRYFKHHQHICVALVLANKSCGAIDFAIKHQVPYYIFNKEELSNGIVTKILVKTGINGIVLAGFLMKMPEELVKMYENIILNIHPALLPKFGGKGMYGLNVHKAVLEAREKYTGITIHLVNEQYDEGRILEQHNCEVLESDSVEELQERVKTLEREFFPKAIENYFLNTRI
ncbi:MAG: phosphoribosylglycinamide formyltransferase [Flavobacteriales bacterium]